MCKYSAPLMHRSKAKCLLRLNHDCHAIICRASLWSATAIGHCNRRISVISATATEEYPWYIGYVTNQLMDTFMNFLEYWSKNVLFRYLVNPMQNQARSTKWHLAINRSMRSTYWPPLVYFSVWSYNFLVRISNTLPKVSYSQPLLKDSMSL